MRVRKKCQVDRDVLNIFHTYFCYYYYVVPPSNSHCTQARPCPAPHNCSSWLHGSSLPSVYLCKWRPESWMVVVPQLKLQTENTHKARVPLFVYIPTSYTYTNLYIFVPVHASIRCKPSFSCCSEYVYFAQNLFGFMTRQMYGRPRHRTELIPTPHIRKGLCSGLIYRMQWRLHFANEMCKFPSRENLLDWTCFDNTRRKEKITKKKSFKIIKTYGKWREMIIRVKNFRQYCITIWTYSN